MVVKDLSIAGTWETMGTVTAAEANRPRSIDGHNEVGSQYTVAVEDFFANEGFGHSGHDRLNLLGLQIRKGRLQGIAMRERLHSKEGLEFDDRGTVAEQQPNVASRFELKEEHCDTGEGKGREGMKGLRRISRVGDIGEQRGKNHQRNGAGCPSEHESTLVALPALFLAGQELSLSLGYLCHETLEKLSFLNPSLHLLSKFHGNI